MYNKIILVGYLTRDVEIRYTQGGSAVGSVGIATSKKWKSQTGETRDETMFIDLNFFGRTAEIANQYLKRGSKVLVDGRLVFQQWVGQDGRKRSKHSVAVENLKMLDTKAESQNLGYNGYTPPQQQSKTSHQTSSYTPQQTRQAPVPEIDIDEDEIPF